MNLRDHFMPQLMMRRVLYSLIPVFLFALWQYGWRLVVLLSIVTIAGILGEFWVMRLIQRDKVKVTESVLVTCVLYTLTLPPMTPFYIAVLGILFAVIFGKGIFGGFGRNFFNPALVGRCFVYICFPAALTNEWVAPFSQFPGGFAAFAPNIDAMVTATPMLAIREGGDVPSLLELVLGTHAGSLGESSAILIVAAAIYLIATKTASWKIMLSTLIGGLGSATVFQLLGGNVSPLETVLLTGGLLFAAVFMATDPISAPKDETVKVIYGLLIGIFALTIRVFGVFIEGAMFAVLITNALTPLMERQVKAFREYRKNKSMEVQA